VVDAARERGLTIVDATCSDVTRTHDLVRELTARGVHVIYIGKRGHPEPAGVMGVAPDNTTLIESIEEADALEFPPGTVWRSPARPLCRCGTPRPSSTTSPSASPRWRSTTRSAGPPRSARRRRCWPPTTSTAWWWWEAAGAATAGAWPGRRGAGHKPAFLVDSAAELRPEWFRGIRRVGVTSGASTPTLLTREVVAALEAMPDAEEITAPS